MHQVLVHAGSTPANKSSSETKTLVGTGIDVTTCIFVLTVTSASKILKNKS